MPLSFPRTKPPNPTDVAGPNGKSDDTSPQTSTDASELAAAPEKPSIADLKSGKVVLKQKPISFEKHSETLKEIVKFRELLEERAARRADSLTAFPEEHKSVIAKLAHESGKTLSDLSKHILQELLPMQDDDGQGLPPPLTLPVVESAIKSVADRNNYSLDGLPGVKAPAAVYAKLDLKAIFVLLPKDEQDNILDPKGTSGGKASSKDGPSSGDNMKSPPQPSKKKKENEENDATSAPKSLMKNFFKTGNTARASPEKDPQTHGAPSSSDIPQFEKTFKPFVVKKDTTLRAFLERDTKHQSPDSRSQTPDTAPTRVKLKDDASTARLSPLEQVVAPIVHAPVKTLVRRALADRCSCSDESEIVADLQKSDTAWLDQGLPSRVRLGPFRVTSNVTVQRVEYLTELASVYPTLETPMTLVVDLCDPKFDIENKDGDWYTMDTLIKNKVQS
ncbi:hypothetical protein DFH07DRAFT_984374 [Mycena maculata]|uniref:Uncharacterized protein n=1 Tax=Mycena maculata TaxID=230809 RepID=A0AAD7IAA5_9AGAR|nr:hypothetical protein DFH07DRAFT_984374 [Mycena maculata]